MTVAAAVRSRVASTAGLRAIVAAFAAVPIVTLGVPSEIPFDSRVLASPVVVGATSPLLLERSGIGRPEVLRRAGVPVRRESPRVGEGLVEQRSITVKARLRPGLGLGPRLGTRAKRLLAAGRYLVDRRWPVGAGAYELAALIAAGGSATPGGSAAQHSDRPDTQLLFRPLTTDDTGLGIAPHARLRPARFAW